MGNLRQDRADVVIRSAKIVDGTGSSAIESDVAINDDRISEIGDLRNMSGNIEISGAGKILAPGFVDVHTHDDRELIINPDISCKTSQGVTTVVTGNCGISLAPINTSVLPAPLDLIADHPRSLYSRFNDYLQTLDANPPAVNVAAQVGHSTLRIAVMSDLERTAAPKEVSKMRAQLDQALEDGAIGMSTGLYYEPAAYASTDEVIALAKSVHEAGGIHTTHMRNEGDEIEKSLQETFRIGLDADVPIVISHHKVGGVHNFGRSKETLQMIDQAKKAQSVGFDVYPYIASSTVLGVKRLEAASRILVTWSKSHPEMAGQDLAEIAKNMNVGLVDAAKALAPAGAIYFMMSEDDVQRILSHPDAMIGSDGLPHDDHPHPRLWGTFPRVLGRYVRQLKLFTLEEAIRRMTNLPAKHFGLLDRGTISVGSFADLVLFDADTIIDEATIERPVAAARGIDLVFVNGRVVWQNGASTGARPGIALRRQSLASMGLCVPSNIALS